MAEGCEVDALHYLRVKPVPSEKAAPCWTAPPRVLAVSRRPVVIACERET